MSELPRVMAQRFVTDYGLPEYDAGQLTQSKTVAAYFEAVTSASREYKLASNWISGELSRRFNLIGEPFGDSLVTPMQLAALINRIGDGTISNNAGRQVFEGLALGNQLSDDAQKQVDAIIEAKGLKQMSDTGELEKIIDDVLAAKNVEEVKAGNAKAMNALVGQAMKATKGKANPAQVNELLRKKLA
jgi:aspartyl-tRNA(Asn)/glutamyl-tRNA(Gln) amidotransferase subunit B